MFSIGALAMMMQILFMIQQTMLYKMAFKYGGDVNATLMAASLRVYGFGGVCAGADGLALPRLISPGPCRPPPVRGRPGSQ